MFRVVWLPVCWPLWVCVRLAGVGKSSILLRFTDDVFDDVAPTIGVDFKVKALDVDGRRVKITAWDTGTFSISLRWVSRGVSSGGAVSLSFPRQPIDQVGPVHPCLCPRAVFWPSALLSGGSFLRVLCSGAHF